MDSYSDILEKVKEQIVEAQYRVMATANVIVEYSQWGGKFVENLSKDLRMEYSGTQGYSVRNLNFYG